MNPIESITSAFQTQSDGKFMVNYNLMAVPYMKTAMFSKYHHIC